MIMTKNIYMLPTDKSNRLAIYDNNLRLNKQDWIKENNFIIPQNIYITSNEIIKEKDIWYLWGDKIKQNKKRDTLKSFCKKIILTTDQDLIKDGIQAIPDDFLEWFVKNSTCEKVEVVNWYNSLLSCCKLKEECYCNRKRIIIPKEELNSKLLGMSSKNIDSEFVDIVNKEFFKLIQDRKEETLEEFILDSSKHNNLVSVDSSYANFHNQSDLLIKGAKLGAKWQQEQIIKSSHIDEVIEFIETFGNGTSQLNKTLTINDIYELLKELSLKQEKQQFVSDIFREGIKWQQERSYSEEDMKKAFNSSSLINMLDIYDSFKKFIEQFKKK